MEHKPRCWKIAKCQVEHYKTFAFPGQMGEGEPGGGRDALKAECKGSNSCMASDPFAAKESAEGVYFFFCSGTVGACLSSISPYQSSASFGLAGPGADPVPKSLTQIT